MSDEARVGALDLYEADPGLATWVEEVLVAVEGDAPAIVPDFAEVVARAHAMDPQVVTDVMLDEARALAPVIPLGAVASDAGPDAGLAGFLDDVRAEGEAAAEARKLAAIPSPAAPLPRRRRFAWAGAAAALFVLGVGMAAAMSGSWRTPVEPAIQAQHDAARGETPQRVEPAPVPSAEPIAAEPEPQVPAQTRAVEAMAPEPARPEASGETQGAVEDHPRGHTEASADERLRELDAQAQRAWKAGELDEAERLFREIIRVGRRGRYVELAYGDLFALARRKDEADRVTLWKEYLRKFPSGRHADDAHGGLCRVAPASERAQCWERYLERMPGGSYRHEAMRALEQDP